MREHIGDITVSYVPDGEVRANPIHLFPGTTADEWHQYDELLDEKGRATFSVGSFLVRTPNTVALIDLGLGPTQFETPNGASYIGGRLIENLKTEYVHPDDVDLVIYTHLHRDHVGWTSEAADSGIELTFRHARHVVHRAEWEYWQNNNSPVGPDNDTVLGPLGDRIDLCEDLDILADGIQVLATPGHTPGHLGVIIHHPHNSRRIVIAGDALHSPAQLHHPEWCFGADVFPEQAATSRAKLLALSGDDVLACGHFSSHQFVSTRAHLNRRSTIM
jgi:glyoxylase-like metal-dependent hydrolase (beta-lactamase superfamily II)